MCFSIPKCWPEEARNDVRRTFAHLTGNTLHLDRGMPVEPGLPLYLEDTCEECLAENNLSTLGGVISDKRGKTVFETHDAELAIMMRILNAIAVYHSIRKEDRLIAEWAYTTSPIIPDDGYGGGAFVVYNGADACSFVNRDVVCNAPESVQALVRIVLGGNHREFTDADDVKLAKILRDFAKKNELL